MLCQLDGFVSNTNHKKTKQKTNFLDVDAKHWVGWWWTEGSLISRTALCPPSHSIRGFCPHRKVRSCREPWVCAHVCVSLYRTNIEELVGVYFAQCCDAASLPLGRGTIDPPSVQQPEALSGNSLGGKLINHHCSARENFASLPLTVLLIFRQRETLKKAFAAGNRPRAAQVQGFWPPLDVEAARTLSFKDSVAPLIDWRVVCQAQR